jgi:hypothetical protein
MTWDPLSTRMNRNCPLGPDEAACAAPATWMPEPELTAQILAGMMVRGPDCRGPCLPPAVRNAPIVRRKMIGRHSTPIALPARGSA